MNILLFICNCTRHWSQSLSLTFYGALCLPGKTDPEHAIYKQVFQVRYFKSWKMMLWKCCTPYASKFGRLSSGHRTGKGPLPSAVTQGVRASKAPGQDRLLKVRMKSRWRSECWTSVISRSQKPKLVMRWKVCNPEVQRRRSKEPVLRC